MTIMTRLRIFVGIDVSKNRLDVFVSGGGRFSVPNTAAGLLILMERLANLDISAIGLEASGGYERKAIFALQEAGLPVKRLDSWRVRQFAKMTGQRAKTDAIDAEMIARFLETLSSEELTAAYDEKLTELQELVSYRRILVDADVAFGNRHKQLNGADAAALSEEFCREIKAQIKKVDARIRAFIAADPDLSQKAELLTSAPGVGFVTAATMLAELPELGKAGPKHIASLVGVAPYPRQSGKSGLRGRCVGGRSEPRRVLFIAVLSQLSRQSWAKDLLERFHSRGKPKMVGIVAMMRRLLVALNAMLKKNRPWEPPTQTA